jgi:hypothetical protein
MHEASDRTRRRRSERLNRPRRGRDPAPGRVRPMPSPGGNTNGGSSNEEERDSRPAGREGSWGPAVLSREPNLGQSGASSGSCANYPLRYRQQAEQAQGGEVIRTSARRSGQTGLLVSSLPGWRSLMTLRDLRIVRNRLSSGHQQQRRKPSPGSTCVYAAQTSDGPTYEWLRLIAQPAPCRSTLSCGSSPATRNNPPQPAAF